MKDYYFTTSKLKYSLFWLKVSLEVTIVDRLGDRLKVSTYTSWNTKANRSRLKKEKESIEKYGTAKYGWTLELGGD